ncbi:hypothetical protein C8Q70DRAFT_997980 [Cubamyces menziesii]|nr:hypothetical protein C8Q70DRAFT_997980 [Cubamyces menziesii]
MVYAPRRPQRRPLAQPRSEPKGAQPRAQDARRGSQPRRVPPRPGRLFLSGACGARVRSGGGGPPARAHPLPLHGAPRLERAGDHMPARIRRHGRACWHGSWWASSHNLRECIWFARGHGVGS